MPKRASGLKYCNNIASLMMTQKFLKSYGTSSDGAVFHNFYIINSSPLLVTKNVFTLTINIDNNKKEHLIERRYLPKESAHDA